VTVAFEDVPVANLGDGAAAMRYTATITQRDGAKATVPALVGAVEDGGRLVVLISLAKPTGGPAAVLDPAAFTSLLRKAYQAQADAFG
jgi:hypothetical protein